MRCKLKWKYKIHFIGYMEARRRSAPISSKFSIKLKYTQGNIIAQFHADIWHIVWYNWYKVYRKNKNHNIMYMEARALH